MLSPPMALPTHENAIIVPLVATTSPGADRSTRDLRARDLPARLHGFHRVPVARVVHETDDARSFVLDVPPELAPTFAYRAGQFCTFRVVVDGVSQLRCYSMSSAPELDEHLTVTVKRVPGGAVSNWLIDHVAAGDEVEVTAPAGVYVLGPSDGPVVAFAAGSGITPIMSLVRSALVTTDRDVHLVYANRDPDSTIFRGALDQLAASHGERLLVQHRWDVEHGFLDAAAVEATLDELGPDSRAAADVYICGPTPFMDVVESSVLDAGVDPRRVHIERFSPADSPGSDSPGPDGTAPDTPGSSDEAATADVVAAAATTTVVIEIDGRSGSTEHRPGTTVLQTARQLGLDPPYSCESGSCATCMAKVVEGTVTMHVNDALTDAEVDEGWVLTCQSVPTSPTVHVVYGFD